MNIPDARAWVRRSARDGDDETTNQMGDVDRAIMYAGQEFCRVTRVLKKAEDVALTASSTSFPLTTPIANGFRPERIIDCCITSPAQEEPLMVLDYPQYNRAVAQATAGGPPTLLTFIDWTTAAIWPAADVDCTAKLRYWLPFTTWEPGEETTATLNIPDDLIIPVLAVGAVAILKGPSPEKTYASVAWQRFQDYMREIAGAGGFGSNAIYRQPSRQTRTPLRTIREY